MRQVVEFDNNIVAEVVHLYDLEGKETFDRYKAEAIVVAFPDGSVLSGSVEDPVGIHPVH